MKKIFVCLDVGGTQIKAASVDAEGGIFDDGIRYFPAEAGRSAEELLGHFEAIIREVRVSETEVAGIRLAFPGPFDYENGICLLRGLDKYDRLHAANLRGELAERLFRERLTEGAAQLKELESQVQAAEKELRDIVSGAEQVGQEYAQLVNWAGLYDNCTFESRKMIVAQFVKAVHIKRGYEVDIEFNVSFEEFQALYLEPEAEESKRKRRGREILALAEYA